MTKRLAILAQFDPDGGVPTHVRIHLERLRTFVDRLVLVSNSPIAPDAARDAEALCDKVMGRENTGWDFAAWRDALATEDLTSFDSVILTNSSVIGPLYPLEPVLQTMEAKDADIWGMVETLQRGRHLHSYFLSVTRKVAMSDAWKTFWGSVENLDDKRQVIDRYEIGFSRRMREAGFILDALVPVTPFPRNIRMVSIAAFQDKLHFPFSANRINRAKALHFDLLRDGMPYLKASLVEGKDAARFVGIDRIRSLPGVDYPFEDLKVDSRM